MKTKLKQKRQSLFALILSIAMVFSMMPAMEVKANEKISTVSATTMTILAGTNISEALKSVQFDESKMKFDQVTFYDNEAKWQWNSKLNGETADKFVEGKTYEITIRLEALEGYSFALTSATINGIPAVIETQSAGSVTFTCEYTVPEATAVNSVDIFVTAPKSGEVPDITARIADAQKDKVSVSGDVYWGYGETGNIPVLSNEGIFVKGNEYKVVVTLETAPGYKLAEDTVCTINGKPATFNKENNTATYTFPELEVTVLKNVDIFVTDPKSGEVPDTTARIADAQKDKVSVSGNVYWGYGPTGSYPVLSNEGIFVKGNEYKVVVTLATAPGCKITEETTFTINGNPAAFNKEYNTVTYTFPLLETTVLQTVEASCDLIGGVKLSDYQIGIPEEAYYEVNASSVKWYEGVGSSVTLISNLNTKIDDTREYTLEFDLVAKDGYGFPSTATFDIEIPKEASFDVTLYDTTSKATIKVLFAKQVIGATNITVPIPVVGESLPTVEIDNEKCGLNSVCWYLDETELDPSTYVVEEGKTYKTDIILKAEARYKFGDTAEYIAQCIKINNEIVNAADVIRIGPTVVIIKNVTLESHCHNYSTEWSIDATNHWHECACGEKADVAAHTFDAGKVTKAPTETTEGVKTFTCTVCGATKTEIIPATRKTGTPNTSGTTGTPDTPGMDKTIPSVGTKLKDAAGKAVYKVTSADKTNPTVEYTAPVNKNAKSVTIPATIKVNGITYKVTSIAKNAFKNNKKLTKIIIGKNVASIGAKAFYGCKKLKSITIKTTKLTGKKVGKQVFKKIHAKATIKVPKSKFKAYKKMLKAKGVGAKAKIKK